MLLYLQYGLLIGLAIALLVAAYTDLKSRRIDNWLNGAIALGAPLFWWASGLNLWPDVAIQLGLALGVFAIFAALFAAGLLGGGDVKLLTSLALWLTPAAFMQLLMVMALAGGAIAVWFVIRRVVWRPKTPGVLPYGVAIAAGGLWVIALTYFPEAALAAAMQ